MYHTYYSLRMEGSEDKIQEVLNSHFFDERIETLVKDEEYEGGWYDFEKDFANFAKDFPDVLFIVHGDGEESDDIWEQRFKGFKNEYHKTEIPPFTYLLTERETKQKQLNID